MNMPITVKAKLLSSFYLSIYIIITVCFQYDLNVHCISYEWYTSRGVFIWRINYCHLGSSPISI